MRAGDILRCLYAGDGFGNASYSEFQIDAVLSEDSLRLMSGPAAPVTVPQKIEIWRNLAKADIAASWRSAGGALQTVGFAMSGPTRSGAPAKLSPGTTWPQPLPDSPVVSCPSRPDKPGDQRL